MANDSTLFKAVNNWATTLTNDVTDTDTTITLDSVDGLPTTGGVLTFTDNNEIVHYTSISGNDLTVERGYDGTTAASHSAGQKVEMRWIAAHHNVLKDEIISHEGNTSNPHNVTKEQVGAIGSVVEDASPQAGGEFDFQDHSAGFTLQDITGNGSVTIDWRNSNKAKVTLSADTTLSFTDPTKPCNLTLEVVQDSTGGWTLTLPTIKWSGGTAPTLTTTANGIDVISLFYDGTDYYGVASLNFS